MYNQLVIFLCIYALFLQLDYKFKAFFFLRHFKPRMDLSRYEQVSLLRINRFINFLSKILSSAPSTQDKNQQAFLTHNVVFI